MLEAIKTYKQHIGTTRFIGKKYSSGIDAWTEWKEKGLTESVKQQINANLKHIYEDGDALIGLMCHKEGNHNNFEYWLGYFTPENTPVPEGLEYEDFSKINIAICWFNEEDENKYDLACEALENIEKEGYIITTEWWFEHYSGNHANISEVGFFVE